MELHRMLRMDSRDGGFSVIELLVVVTVTTILFLASIPALRRHTETINLKRASEGIAATLKLARQRAVATNKSVVVVFDSDNGTFYLFEDTDADGIHDLGETMSGPYSVPNQVTISSVSFGSGTVAFDPRGSASETGSVVLVNTRNRAQTVDLTAATGLVYVSDIYAYEG